MINCCLFLLITVHGLRLMGVTATMAAPAFSKAALLPNAGGMSTLSGRIQAALYINARRQRQPGRHLQSNTNTTSLSCSEDPFLWMIQKDTSNNSNSTADAGVETVGFAVGTFHVPREIVLSDAAWTSLSSATEDSCAVYGEVDLTNPQILEEVTACTLALQSGDSATVNDIPDPELQDQYKSILLEIARDYGPLGSNPQLVAEQLSQSVSLDVVIQMIQAYNTPQYNDMFFPAAFAGQDLDFLYKDLLELGRPSGGIEEVETECKLVEMMAPDKTEFTQNFDSLWGPQLEATLTSSLTGFVQAYKCGRVEGVLEELLAEEEENTTPVELMTALLDGTSCMFQVSYMKHKVVRTGVE